MNEHEVIEFARDWMGAHITEAVRFERSAYVGPHRWTVRFSDELNPKRLADVVVYTKPGAEPEAQFAGWWRL